MPESAPAQATEAPAEAPKPVEETKPVETPKEEWDRKLKIKVHGKEEELDLSDPDVRARVQTEYQISKAGREELRRAKEALKKIEDFRGRVAQDPISALKDMGFSEEQAIEYFEKEYLRRMEKQGMTPEQRRALELEQENQTLREREKQIQKQAEQERQQQLVTVMQERLERGVMDAAQKSGLLTGDPQRDAGVFRGILSHLRDAVNDGYVDERGYPLLTAEEAVAHYRLDQKALRQDALKRAKIEEILEELGPELSEALARHRIDKARGEVSRPAPTPAPEKKEKKYMTPDEARAESARRAGLA